MSPPTDSSTGTARRRVRRLISAGASLALTLAVGLTSAGLSTSTASADSAVSPKNGSFTVTGAGFGHGWGMSQYGAYGAATKGLTWQQILAFYYPGTTRSQLKAGATIKVWITADNDSNLTVLPATGLKVTDSAGKALSLPTGSAYMRWRVTRSGSGFALASRNGDGAWKAYSHSLGTGTWRISSTAKIVKVILPSGAVREYRGTASLIKYGTSARTVNNATMEDYVKGVVPAEMPTSWSPHAIRTQAVAARTYAARLQAVAPTSRGYDLCDTTACQVYGGKGAETANGNSAQVATSGTILRYGSAIALTQFSSSNGGHSATGDFPYLQANPDPYDGVIKSQVWTRTFTASKIRSAYPSVGTLRSIQIATRDGHGRWGGRVKSMKLIGSARTVTITGDAFRIKFGLRSSLFTFGGAGATPPSTPPPAPPAGTNKPGTKYATFPRSYHSGSVSDLLIINSSGQTVRYPVSKSIMGSGTAIGSGFKPYSHVVNVGDWNGDGFQDVVGRSDSGAFFLHRGTSSGKLTTRVSMGFSGDARAVTSPGDLSGDGKPDLLVLSNAGNLWLSTGNGKTGRSARIKINSGWGSADWLRGVGDFNRDGWPDVVTKQGTSLYLHPGKKNGFGTKIKFSGSWTGISSIASAGDVTGDGRSDLVARTSSGSLVLYGGNGKTTLTKIKTLKTGFGGTRFAT